MNIDDRPRKVWTQVAYNQYDFYRQELQSRVQTVEGTFEDVWSGFWVDRDGKIVDTIVDPKIAVENLYWIPPSQILGISRTHIYK